MRATAILSLSVSRNFNVIAVALFRYFTQRRLSFATRRRVQRPLCNCTLSILQHLDFCISTFVATFAHKIPPAYNNERISNNRFPESRHVTDHDK